METNRMNMTGEAGVSQDDQRERLIEKLLNDYVQELHGLTLPELLDHWKTIRGVQNLPQEAWAKIMGGKAV